MNFFIIYSRTAHFYIFLLLLILFTLVYPSKAYSSQVFKGSFFEIVESEGKDFEYYKIETYLYRIEHLVYQTLGRNLEYSKCEIYLKKNADTLIDISQSNKGNWRVNLKKNYLELINNKNVSASLFKILIVSFLNVPYIEKKINSLNWYVSALNRKLYRILKPEIYPENASYPAINFLLVNGYKFKVENIIADISKPNEQNVSKFNSEADEILLNTIFSMKNGKKFLKLFLLKSYENSKKETPIKIFYSVLSNFISSNEKEAKLFFNEQLNLIAEKYALSVFMPSSYYYIQKQFYDACFLTYIPKDKTDLKLEIKLEDLPEVYDKVEPDYFNQIKQNISGRFMRLQRITPFFAEKPISKILKTVNSFNPKQKKAIFKEKILLYKREFNQALEKGKQVYFFLKEKELKHVRAPVRYYYYFDAISTGNNFNKKIWPELNEYLTQEYKY